MEFCLIKQFVFQNTDVWKTREQRAKQLKCSLCLTLAIELFYSGRQVYGKIKRLKRFFGGGNIKQTFSAIVVPDFLCGYGAYLAVWCVLLW